MSASASTRSIPGLITNVLLTASHIYGTMFLIIQLVFVVSFECMQDVDGRGAIPAVRHSWVVNSGTSCQVRGLAPGVTYRLDAH